jgi:formyl-CoA transferase
VIEDPQIRHLDTFYEETHPTEGRNLAIYRPVLIDGRRDPVAPSPTLGEHSEEILAELGLGRDEIDRLKAAGII